jgi:hypothetical protein
MTTGVSMGMSGRSGSTAGLLHPRTVKAMRINMGRGLFIVWRIVKYVTKDKRINYFFKPKFAPN